MIFLKRRKRRKIWIISSILFIIAACLSAFLLCFNVEITLNGEGNIKTEAFSELEDNGANGYMTLSLIGLKLETKVTVTDNVDTNTVGQYRKEYSTSFLWKKASVFRNVEVVDTTPPEITAESKITVDFTNGIKPDIYQIPLSFEAKDNYDGDITDRVVKNYDDKYCTLTVTDKSGNAVSHVIEFDFVDKQLPVITLESNIPVYLSVGEKYIELNYTATDDVDGDITSKVKVLNKPNTLVAGTYNVSYEVTDSSFNTTTKTHKVIVYEKWEKEEQDTIVPAGKTIYLTFDDGPGVYTEYLLKVLNYYNVKATFFVTNQFPKYTDLIGKAYKKGHSIGVHTYSHRFDTVYSSIENYLEDFNKIQEIIEKQTGKKAKIFRFPGGTSNTVSQKYATGIMKALVSEMNNRGYVYFDWNYDCGDTSGKKAKQIYNGILNHIDTRFETEDSTIILLHDIKPETVKAMAKTIEYCLKKGYTFAALDVNSPNRQFDAKN